MKKKLIFILFISFYIPNKSMDPNKSINPEDFFKEIISNTNSFEIKKKAYKAEKDKIDKEKEIKKQKEIQKQKIEFNKKRKKTL
jgi:hypothetical protein